MTMNTSAQSKRMIAIGKNGYAVGTLGGKLKTILAG